MKIDSQKELKTEFYFIFLCDESNVFKFKKK